VIRKCILNLTHARAWPAPFKRACQPASKPVGSVKSKKILN
jgi:hypothetical protein